MGEGIVRTAVRAFRAEIGQIDRLYVFVKEALRDAGVPGKYLPVMEIASDEIFSNIANHAYGDDPARYADDAVVVELSVNDKAIELTFSDRAKAFDPLSVPTPDIDKGADRDPGGLGVYLARSVVDDMKYSRSGGRNVLTLIKLTGDA